MTKFNKLDVPYQWKDFFTKYPHGYTIFEALCNWTKQVDEMVVNQNNWNEYLDNFVQNFEFELQEEVQSTIGQWQDAGLLDEIITQALNTRLDSVEDTLNARISDVEIETSEIEETLNDHITINESHITRITDKKAIIAVNPFNKKAYTYKGQLHCHTNNSDGLNTPSEVVNAYKNVGYKFIAITDHDVITGIVGASDIIQIPATEKTVNEGHMPCYNIISVPSNNSGQMVVNTVNNADGFSSIAHSNLPTVPYPKEKTPNNVNLFEIYNAWGDNPYAEDNYDYLLTKGYRPWCVAVDDNHNINSKFNSGYVVINADDDDIGTIISELKNGNFYASQGPNILDLYIKNNTIYVETSDVSEIRFIMHNGLPARTSQIGTSADCVIRGHEQYVRVEIIRISDGKKAWSQPIYLLEIDDGKTERVQDYWIEITDFANNYEPSDPIAQLPKPAYYKDTNGIVHFRGGITGGKDGRPAFTMPEGYRPEASVCCALASGGFTISSVRARDDGEVIINHQMLDGEVPYYIDLSGLKYRVK